MVIVSKMKLKPGNKDEYKKRHDQLWEKMRNELINHGVEWYKIFLDQDNISLFSIVSVENENLWNKISESPICKEWWKYMADIMETNSDYSPIIYPLSNVFSFKK